jgi:aspartate/methionine/tyrosine aminotransferase
MIARESMALMPEFALERYFAQWEFAVRHVLCASDVEPMSLRELLALASPADLRRWESLSLGYTESLGLPALREEIAGLYDGLTGDDVITFAGAEEGIFLAMHALLMPADHAIVVMPAYQSLHQVAQSIGAAVTFIPLDPRDWSLDVERIASEVRPNTRLIVVNFPHNPTGAQLEHEQFERLVDIAESAGAHLFSDEVYRYLELEGRQPLPAAAARSRRGISLGVMSKSFGLGGLRIGWIASRDRALVATLATLKDYTTLCNSAPSEQLALIALRAREVILEGARSIVHANLAVLDAFFARNVHWCSWVRPRAGSVCFPRLLTGDADQFAADLVRAEGVLILPGSQLLDSPHHFRLGLGRRGMPEALAAMEQFANVALHH